MRRFGRMQSRERLPEGLNKKHSPAEHGGILNSLDKVVREHHSCTKTFLQETPHAFTVAKVLLNGPGFSPEQ